MENISLVGKSKYIPAKPDNVTTEEVIRNSLKFLWILLKSFLDYLPYLLYSIYEFVVGKKPKNIHGQLALGKSFLMVKFCDKRIQKGF